MTSHFFFKGVLLGFAIAAPVGPIGVLCIRRTLADGQRAGLVTGLGAATADGLYGCVAAFGLTAVSEFLVKQRFWLGLVGGFFLCYLGLRTFFSKTTGNAPGGQRTGFAGAYLSTFALTITNPMTILSFVAVFAGIGLVGTANYVYAATLVGGVFVGSALWWLLLSGGASLLRSRIGPSVMQWVNRGSGTLIFLLGVYSLAVSMKS